MSAIAKTKNKKNYTVSLLRFIAMLFIILCHFFQYYGLELAWWFNVGVQMFFFISGFLYGGKRISSAIDYICGNFRKILIPYYCFLIPAIIAYFLFHKEFLGMSGIVNALLTSGTIKGMEHLWFISYILFCYIITPYLQALADKMKKLKWYLFLIVFFAIAVFGHILSLYFNSYFMFSRLFCYLFGYFAAVFMQSYKNEISKRLTLILAIVTIVMNIIRIYGVYISPFESSKFQLFVQYSHAFLGITIVLVFVVLFRNIKPNKILDLSDKYSFYIYIVHQLFILSPFTLLTATDIAAINVIITLIAIILSAMFLKLIADVADKFYLKITKSIKTKILS